MSESALERTARALDLIPYLLEHQGASVAELAARFSVTELQITQDLTMLHMCGLPGYTPLELIDMYYEDGYVTVSDPQSLNRPRKMTRGEMTALLVGLDVIKSIGQGEHSQEISELAKKLLSNSTSQMDFVVVESHAQSDLERTVASAIAKSQKLRIEYISGNSDKRSERTIIPLELYLRNGNTYLDAWCISSQADRTFRVDRIVDIEVLAMASESEIVRNRIEPVPEGEITLHISSSARSFFEENQGIFLQIDSQDDGYLVRVQGVDQEWLRRAILGYGDQIRITEPRDFATELKGRAKATLALYIEV